VESVDLHILHKGGPEAAAAGLLRSTINPSWRDISKATSQWMAFTESMTACADSYGGACRDGPFHEPGPEAAAGGLMRSSINPSWRGLTKINFTESITACADS